MKRKGIFILAVHILLFSFASNLEYARANQIKLKVEASNSYPVHNLNTGLNYTSIQKGINANETLNGHTIIIDPGTYYEHIVLNKSLTLIGEHNETTIIDGNGTGNVVTINENYVNITSITVQNSGRTLGDAGIYFDSARFCNISGNHITDNFAGVWLEESSKNLIVANDIVANEDDGIVFNNSHNNTVSGNHIAIHEYFGIVLNWSHNNTISWNNVTQTLGPSHGDGINLWRSEHNHIRKNHVVANNRYGIRLEVQSNNNIVSGNNIENCSTGLQVYDSSNFNDLFENNISRCSDGIEITRYSMHNNLSNNTVTNSDFGISIEDWSANNTVFGNNITAANLWGVHIYRSDNNQVSGNNIAHNWGGIDIHGRSNHNYITGNNITNSTYGFISHDSDNNRIYRSNITDCAIALWLQDGTNYNVIVRNNVANNDCGIQLETASTNTFYHNNFADNTFHVSIIGYSYDNSWDNDYPSSGNYWSNYTGVDQYNGLNQNVQGSDGIGDTPHIIDQNNRDRYPFINPDGWKNHPLSIESNMTVTNKVVTPAMLQFNVSGPTASTGYVKITMPKGLNTTTIRVFLDETELISPPFPIITANDTQYFIYFEFILSDHHITIQYAACDISVTEISLSRTIVGQGYSVLINATAVNVGDVNSAFMMIFQANSTAFGNQTGIFVEHGTSVMIPFTWSTINWPKGNYTVSIYANPIEGEDNISNNVLTSDHEVCITIPGDVDADSDVDIFDIVKIAVLYGCSKPDPKYNPVSDINGDGDVDIVDVIIACSHYKEGW